MKSYFSKLLFFIATLSVTLSAQEMFWEVNGTKGGKVYILGSLDMGNMDMYPLSENVINAFKQSNYLILEMGRGVGNESFINDQLYVKARYEDNDSIINHLTQKSYKALGKCFKEHKIAADSMDRFEPWVAGLTLTELDMALRGDEKRLSMEDYFYQRAKRVSKGVYTLERIANAFLRLKNSKRLFQDKLLKVTMDLRVKTYAEARERFRHYQEGNRTYFQEKLIDPFKKYPEIEVAVLNDKSHTFFKKIMMYRENKRGRHYFLIVGLESLLGEKGILAQLKEAGVDVKEH